MAAPSAPRNDNDASAKFLGLYILSWASVGAVLSSVFLRENDSAEGIIGYAMIGLFAGGLVGLVTTRCAELAYNACSRFFKRSDGPRQPLLTAPTQTAATV